MKKPSKKVTLLDFLWVLQAFLRGKVLRQKDYRPQGNVFCLSTQTNYKRITMLMDWWGHRPATLKETMALMAEVKMGANNDRIFSNPELPFWFGPAPMLPYLYWDDGAWRLRYSCDWFDNDNGGITLSRSLMSLLSQTKGSWWNPNRVQQSITIDHDLALTNELLERLKK